MAFLTFHETAAVDYVYGAEGLLDGARLRHAADAEPGRARVG